MMETLTITLLGPIYHMKGLQSYYKNENREREREREKERKSTSATPNRGTRHVNEPSLDVPAIANF